MVEGQLRRRGIRDQQVPRHEFVPDQYHHLAYGDEPLSIGHGQIISQPYIVAFMTEALNLQPHERVLEIGAGSGYQAAVLSQLAKKVFSIEIVESLADRAKKTLNNLGINTVIIRTGDGYQGWFNEAPFDAIMLTAAPEHIPQPLLDQLVIGGRLILPLGKMVQRLILMKRTQEVWKKDELFPVAFVPMTGEVQELQLKE